MTDVVLTGKGYAMGQNGVHTDLYGIRIIPEVLKDGTVGVRICGLVTKTILDTTTASGVNTTHVQEFGVGFFLTKATDAPAITAALDLND